MFATTGLFNRRARGRPAAAQPFVGDVAHVFGDAIAYPGHEIAVELEIVAALQPQEAAHVLRVFISAIDQCRARDVHAVPIEIHRDSPLRRRRREAYSIVQFTSPGSALMHGGMVLQPIMATSATVSSRQAARRIVPPRRAMICLGFKHQSARHWSAFRKTGHLEPAAFEPLSSDATRVCRPLDRDVIMSTETFIPGKDAALETSIAIMQAELATRASAYGQFFERLATHYFWAHYYLGATRARRPFVHYPQEKWFAIPSDESWPDAMLNPALHALYNPDGEINASVLVDLNSGNLARGICALPYTCLRDGSTAYFPVNIIDNLYDSNGMAAGNTLMEARSQALSEIFERAIKYRVIAEGLCLPDVPDEVIARHPGIQAGIAGLRNAGFGILVKDASLGGKYPVMNVTLIHPKDQGLCSSYGAHPRFEIALERALTALLQGRALDSLHGYPEPGFDLGEIHAVANLETHFIDSSGVISWNFMGDTPDYAFCDWHFSGTTQQDYDWLVNAIHAEDKDVYVADFSEQGRSEERGVGK